MGDGCNCQDWFCSSCIGSNPRFCAIVGSPFTGYGVGSYLDREDIWDARRYGLSCMGGVVGDRFLANESAKDIALAGDGMPCEESDDNPGSDSSLIDFLRFMGGDPFVAKHRC